MCGAGVHEREYHEVVALEYFVLKVFIFELSLSTSACQIKYVSLAAPGADISRSAACVKADRALLSG